MLVAWTHGCIGIHYWLRAKAWYGRARLALYTGALLLPVLALLGFVQGGRTVVALAEDPDWVSRAFRQARAPDAAARATLKSASEGCLCGGLDAPPYISFGGKCTRLLRFTVSVEGR